MVDIPPEVRVKGGLKAGTVYYFKEETHEEEAPAHYFVVLNTNPLSDKILVLVCASSQIANVKRIRSSLPAETLVEVTPSEHPDFTRATIFDCNNVYEKTIEQLIKKLESGQLGTHNSEMAPAIVAKLKEAAKASPLVKRELKELL